MGSSEDDKAPRCETSFTKNGMGLQKTEQKPIQSQKQATATSTYTNENRVKDKTGGPAPYVTEQPMALKNRFEVLESNEDVLP